MKEAKEKTLLTKDQIKSLAKVGITKVETQEVASEKMIAFLKKQEITGVEDDGFDSLLEMVEAMYEGSEDGNDKLAEEVVADEKKSSKKKVAVIEEEKEEEIEEKPKKKSSLPAKKEAAPIKKEAKKDAVKKVSKRLDPLNNEEDAAKFEPLKKALGAKFEYNFIVNGGITAKYLGKNVKKNFLSIDSPKVVDGEIVGRVYLSSIRDEKKLRKLFGDDFEIKKSWSNNLLVVDVPLKELISIIKTKKEEFQEIVDSLFKKDEKLGKSRQKMEDDLKKGNSKKVEAIKKAAAPAKKAAAPAKKK